MATTSNSLPDRLGEGRFSAEDFQREIAAIAEHFAVVRIDGPDVRAQRTVLRETVDDGEVDAAIAAADPVARRRRSTTWSPTSAPSTRSSTARWSSRVETVVIRGLHPVTNQGDALLLVALIDELYDAGRTVLTTGCGVSDLFDESYRHGGYRKKYGRAESRLSAMLGEATARPPPRASGAATQLTPFLARFSTTPQNGGGGSEPPSATQRGEMTPPHDDRWPRSRHRVVS